MSERKSASAYRTISEVAESLGVPQHVLRFWETKFPAVKPLKRGGNRRYYRPEDIELLQVIHKLLHVDGYTIKGAQKLFKERGARALVDELLGGGAADAGPPVTADEAEAETALAEAGIPEALTVDPDAPASAVAADEVRAATAEPEVIAALSEAALEVEAVGGSAPVTPLADGSGAAAAPEPDRAPDTAPLEADRRTKAALVAELRSIRARLADALGEAAPAAR